MIRCLRANHCRCCLDERKSARFTLHPITYEQKKYALTEGERQERMAEGLKPDYLSNLLTWHLDGLNFAKRPTIWQKLAS
jgi:hypothetical protein